LAVVVAGLSLEQLNGPSGAADWSVALVLSHLGSAAEIGHAGLQASIDGTDAPGQDFNEAVWDRWNAMGASDQANGFVESNSALVQTLEALTPDQRENLPIKVSFTPAPLTVATVAGMRLNELALHGWDVRAGLDPRAAIAADIAELQLEHLTGDMSFMLGFIGKADQLSEPAVVEFPGFTLTIADAVAVTAEDTEPTATFAGPLEAAIRLIGGRLKPGFTPADVTVTGNISLDDLRRVFPGY
jgi:uncharacterized protein (TIGR03083 family)